MRCGGVCTMGLAIWPFILCFALALPSQGPPASPRTNCIRMTPEKEQQIDLIVEKLGNFLNQLSIEHEHFDIHLIKLSIEQHSENEVEEKETVLQLSVNDCELSDDELEEIDHHKEKAKQLELEKKEKRAKEQKEKLDKEQKNNRIEKPIDRTDTNTTKDNDYEELKTNKNFEVMYLDLDETGEKLDQALGKKRPKLFYVQKDKGQIDYWYVKNLRR